jgi:hypothetical protein
MTPTTAPITIPPSLGHRPWLEAFGRTARLLLLAGLSIVVLLATACEPDSPTIPPGTVQKIKNVSATGFGTQIAVDFDTARPTDDSRLEVWNGSSLARLVLEQDGTPRTRHNLVAGDLDPGTAYTVKLFVPAAIGSGDVSYTHPTTVSTLVRRVQVTARWARVHNDSDPGGCGELTAQHGLGRTDQGFPQTYVLAAYGFVEGAHTVCDGQAWDPPDQGLTFDDVTEDAFTLEASADDCDGVLCLDGMESAGGSTVLDLEEAPGGFTRDVAVEMNPEEVGGDLRMTWYFRYTVSYHA